jgi:hypothetical protein
MGTEELSVEVRELTQNGEMNKIQVISTEREVQFFLNLKRLQGRI